MKHLLVLLFVVLVLAASVSASSVSTNKAFYNLGDKIATSYSFTPQQRIDALFKLSIVCESYNLPFFIYPLSLETAQPVSLDIPKLVAAEQMIGDCYLDAVVESLNGVFFERVVSPSFVISNKLNISVKLSEKQTLPGKEMIVYGSVSPTYGAFKGNVFVGFDSLSQINLADNSFVYSLTVPSDMSSGQNQVSVVANDSLGNTAYIKLLFGVMPVATTLESSLDRESFDPGEAVKVSVSLLDQGGALMDDEVRVQVLVSNNAVLFDGWVKGEGVEVALPKSAPPGTYKIKSSYANLADEKQFFVSTVEKLEAGFDGRFINLTNTGNVPYEHQVEVVFKSDEEVKAVQKNIDLGIGESVLIDLFKEVPSGIYDVDVRKETLVIAAYNAVSITDERNLIKKTEIDAVTSYITFESEGPRNIFWGFAVLVVLILGFLLFFEERKRRASLGMPKQKDEVEKVFEKESQQSPKGSEDISEEQRKAFERSIEGKKQEAEKGSAGSAQGNRPE